MILCDDGVFFWFIILYTELMLFNDTKAIKFGQHLIFDAYGCDYDSLNSIDTTVKVLNKLVEIAGMHKLMEPYVVNASPNTAVGGKDPGGNSGFVIIQESHISIHTFAKRGFVTIDIYSCKEFETQEIIKYLKEEYNPKDVDLLKLDRGLKYPVKNIY